MTSEILDMIKEKRLAKRNIQKYNPIYLNIHRKIRGAKNKWLAWQCREVKELYAKHDAFYFHKKLRETNIFKKASTSKTTKNNKE